MPLQKLKFTLCMPSGSTILSTAPCGWEGEEREKDKVRKMESGAAGLKNLYNNAQEDDLIHNNVSRTCDARALSEAHCLHALGEHDLVDSTCGREGEGMEKDKMRNEETRAAGPKNEM
jgi:hypothetical protein